MMTLNLSVLRYPCPDDALSFQCSFSLSLFRLTDRHIDNAPSYAFQVVDRNVHRLSRIPPMCFGPLPSFDLFTTSLTFVFFLSKNLFGAWLVSAHISAPHVITKL